ncbi:MAG: endolytic transglycosylase MltG, partial [Propionibacteriaceae bacterium]|nr:endolytic transglycosylase MltG [Propionibacteriaceae bacterium]
RHHHGPGWAVLWLAIVLVVVAALGYVGYTKGLDWVRNLTAPATDYPGPGEADVTVTIPPDASSSAMANILVNADVVASAKAFTNAVKANPASFINIMAGDHQLQTKMSAVEAYNALANPKLFVQKQQFTIPDGLRDTQVFASINKQTGVPVADLEALATQAGSLGLPTWADTTNAEGYLYPDTYGFDDNPTAQEVLQPMVNEFTQVTNSLDFADKAQANGLTPAQAVVLASIIEKEGSNPTYAADIAQVFYNRLKAGMPLQSDATVLYANNVTGNLTTTDAERANPSPYNTYVHTGLPPGPISNPGKDALTAAVNPTQGDYLYFVVVNPATGQVAFASDAAGHSANVAQFQAWCNANPGKC